MDTQHAQEAKRGLGAQLAGPTMKTSVYVRSPVLSLRHGAPLICVHLYTHTANVRCMLPCAAALVELLVEQKGRYVCTLYIS